MREVETTTQPTTQTIDEDDDVQIIEKTRRSGSLSVMMPTDAALPISPTTGPLLNCKLFLIHFNFIIYVKLMNSSLSISRD